MGRTQHLRNMIEEQFLVEFDDELTDRSDLFKAGVIDSFGYVQLLGSIEEEFSIQLKDEDFLKNIFTSLESIDAFVAKKIAERGDR
ncbi:MULTISPECIES: phosphopantetheine-binding protein [Streptomyces]|uniref:phosphopantetheine-binding protein n=1 Tax=Streptomyces TaxID=1883 RepID=UPI0005175352|nr:MULTISPECIES: phosphopantetheine-binding protein [Streptomyces]OKI55103.1 acyl carrier protein [Streptomyces sp. CB00072]MCX4486954.1 phosphopantetheine-binding protein [Streptomyces anulatus]MCX4522933.1 phosphopantetheine-binding protein [Streptomyces anulatus]MCX4605944.1 phosphopantetheine-binding protein [Streptomyces anulatus]WSI81938.1 phosphopantetheine-binding protein [Streptomyces anulatus]